MEADKRRAQWAVTLNEGNTQIRIFKRDGSDMTEDDRETLIMVLTNHFHAEGSNKSDRALARPEAGEGVETRSGITHTQDPIVSFFAAYRKRRRMQVVTVGRLIGEKNGTRITFAETGRVRPLIEFIRDWGYALGFNLMPIPIALADRVSDMVNKFMKDQYAEDIARWSADNEVLIYGGERADIPASTQLPRDGSTAGPSAPRQAASGMLPDPRDPIWGEHAEHDEEPPSSVDVEG